MSCACHTKGSRGPAAATRQLLLEALRTAPATRKVAAAQRRPRAPQLLLEALCTAPATRKAAEKLKLWLARTLLHPPQLRRAATLSG